MLEILCEHGQGGGQYFLCFKMLAGPLVEVEVSARGLGLDVVTKRREVRGILGRHW